MTAPESFDTILVVDFGAQYAQLIARRVREAHVYSEIVPHTITAAEVAARRPAGLIFSGGPASVHVDGAPLIDAGVYELGIPVLGICYGAQLIALQLGGEVARTGRGEYGRTSLETFGASVILGEGAPAEEPVWMSHFDTITRAPDGFHVPARTPDTPAAVLEHEVRRIYGVQFHPEVAHTPRGQEMLKQFLFAVCECRPTWTMASIIETSVDAIRAQVGGERVICGLSGGVDSSVAAATRAQGGRPPAHLRLCRHGPHAGRGERAGRRHLPPPSGHRARPREGGRPVFRRPRRRH